ncbi:hypothetical protein G5714_004235 [Onychostoma macrolepis]|uniref:AIG1-type G domain-containing protein n=1 Tax=Onychostoma macrolepis TaxID=369639 RepID=A0A7J6D4A6_9TELE|nr:hypothetical protein G5714_004235 [Onychostoma macrolepis]
MSPDRSPEINESPKTDRSPQTNESPQTDRSPEINESPKTDRSPEINESPKTDRSPEINESPKTDRSPEINESPKTDRSPEINESPKTDRSPEINESPKTDRSQQINESPKTDRSPQTNESPQTDRSPEINESPKTDRSPEINESPKTDRSPEINESPKTDRSQQINESPKTDRSPEINESPKTDRSPEINESPKTDRSLQTNESPQTDRSPEINESLETDRSSEINESPKTDRSPQTNESPQTDRSPEINESPKTDRSPEINESPKTDRSPEINESPKTDRSPKINESPKTDRSQQINESPQTDRSPEINESPKTDRSPEINESPKTDRSLQTNESPQTDRSPEINESPKTDRSQQINESPQTDRSPEINESPKTDRSQQINESPKTDRSPEINESPKTDRSPEINESLETDRSSEINESPQTDRSPQTNESPQTDRSPEINESPKTERSLQTDESDKTNGSPQADESPLMTAVEKGQKKTIRPCQSAVNNNQKMSRENTSSKTMEMGHSNGKGLSVVHNIKNNWSRIIEDGSNENLPMFKLNLDETWQNSDGFCRRSTFGDNITKGNKTIMMIGATGAGKTTLINSMINYILGVQWINDFRFLLIDEGKQKSQAESQTSEITAYQINHMNGFRVPYSLTIVDTPGFGDTRGISHDQKITKQIQEFFSARGGIDCIDAVCFVVQASLARLTHTQKYIFDSILSIFGKDIAENILMMVTFADGKTPPVLEAIKVAEVSCSTNESGEPLHFKFNNSAVFASNNKSAEDEESDFDEMFWKLGFSSMRKFFTSLNMMNTQSLSLTQEVLKERQQLEVHVQGLQPQINAGLTKLDEIKKTRAALQQHKAEMDANKDFEYELEVTVPKQIEIKTGYYLTNCQKCHFTCHDTCIYADDRDKHKCIAMEHGVCTICPGKCAWNVHFNQKYKWDYVTEKRKETYQDLKKRFEEAHGQVMSKEKIFEELEKEFQVVQDIVAKLIKGSQKSLERLQEIALKPNPLSTPDYIDLMIESEKQEAKPGFQDRIQSLMEVRKKAEIISKVSTGEVLPEDWNDYKPEARKNGVSYNPRVLFNNAVNYISEKMSRK